MFNGAMCREGRNSGYNTGQKTKGRIAEFAHLTARSFTIKLNAVLVVARRNQDVNTIHNWVKQTDNEVTQIT